MEALIAFNGSRLSVCVVARCLPLSLSYHGFLFFVLNIHLSLSLELIPWLG